MFMKIFYGCDLDTKMEKRTELGRRITVQETFSVFQVKVHGDLKAVVCNRWLEERRQRQQGCNLHGCEEMEEAKMFPVFLF